MKCSTEETKTDIFDPFWMLFPDEEFSDEEANKKKLGRRCSSNTEPSNVEDSSLLDFFIPRDDLVSVDEQREPPSASTRQRDGRARHSWRRSQPKKEKERRLSFGIKNKSKKSAATDNELSSWTSDRRDMPSGNLPKRRNAIYKKQDSSDTETAESELLPTGALPNFMDALGTHWDPWGDQESLDDSSAASYSDESSKNDESTETASLASLSLGTEEPREVQQILVQFNPQGDASPAVNETSSVTKNGLTTRSLQSSQLAYAKRNSISTRNSSRQLSFNNYERSLDSLDKFDQEFAVVDDKEHSSGRFNPQRLVCCSTNTNAQSGRFLCRGSSMRSDEDEFPKLRLVSDEKAGGRQYSSVVARIKDFKGDVPAHLQVSPDAFLTTKGPQSLYEYDYDGSQHMDVAYNHFGANPLSLLVIRHHLTPPLAAKEGAVVQVEASTISLTDCSMRNGEWSGRHTPPLPITPGVDFVGKLFHINKDLSSLLHLSVGDRVMSLTRCGGNSRFISIDPAQLVKISGKVDPAEAACLAETYLSAFQALHFGQAVGTRYRSASLKGKSILILGAIATTLGHALVELATAAGVERIFATATPKHFPHLRSLGIMPISLDPALWYDQLNGEIDLFLVADAKEEVVPEHFKVLSDSGHLVVLGQRADSGSPMGDREAKDHKRTAQLVCKRYKPKVGMLERTHDYNPYRQWEADLQKSKKDLGHLVRLLEKGALKPNVLDRIPLSKVAKAQEMVESKRHPSGFLVCEPWLRDKKRAVRL